MRPASLAALVVAAVVVAGCALFPDASGPEGRQADDSFALVLRAGSGRYAENQPIDVSATLSYLGREAGVDIVGSGSGLIVFSAKQLDGRLAVGGSATADCKQYRLDRGQPLQVPYAKSAGWSNDDPDAAFYRAFAADPVFRLPRGRWQISANADFVERECGGPGHALSAAVTIVVE